MRLLLLVLLVWPVRAQHSVEELLEARTLERLRAVAASTDGVFGAAAIDLTSGRALAVNGDTEFPQASVIKVPVMVAMFQAARRGAFALADRVAIEPAEAAGGSGRLKERLKSGRVELTVRELIAAMIEWSDNTATNKCIAMLGMDSVNRALEALGLRKTRLRRPMMDLGAAVRGDENVSTPLEMARLMELLWRGEAAHPEDCREMIGVLKRVQGEIASAAPDGVDVAAKTGQIDGARSEAAIVFLEHRPFAVSINSSYLGRASPVTPAAHVFLDHFERLGRANRYGRFVR